MLNLSTHKAPRPKPIEKPVALAFIRHYFEEVRGNTDIHQYLPETYVKDLKAAFDKQAKVLGGKDHPAYPHHPDEVDALEKRVFGMIADMGVAP